MVKESDYLISNQEILGGLKTAIERGETLKDAMMTFYQAGYDKYEIEDAARAYLNQQRSGEDGLNVGQRLQPSVPEKKEEIKRQEMNKPVEAQNMPIIEKKRELTQQVASAYTGMKKPAPTKNNAVTIILILVLLMLVGVLAAVFLFRNELVDFINKMFG